MAAGRTICLPSAIGDGSPRTPLTETCLSMRTSGCRNLREYRVTLTYDRPPAGHVIVDEAQEL